MRVENRMVFKVAYGILYGGLVATAYLYARLKGHSGGLTLFGAAGACIFLGHLFLFPRLILAGLRDPKMCFRGLLYGLTQVLIFKAQATGFTSTALIASVLGGIFGVILGRLALREKVEGLAFVAVICAFVAALMNPALLSKSYWGILGGLIQGTGFVLARSLMLARKSIRQSISTGFAMAAFVSFAALTLDGLPPWKVTVGAGDLGVVIAIALLVQYGFFFLYKHLDSQRASILTLSRIPWAMTLEHWLVGAPILLQQAVSAALIALGSILLVLDAGLARVRPRPASSPANA